MAQMMLVNPRKRARRKTAKKRAPARRRRTLTAVRRPAPARRRRRNPARRGLGGMVQSTLMPAATAAGGALGLDVIMGLLPLPAAMKTGPMRHIVKGAGAIGMGMVAGMFVKAETAKLFTSGALTVAMYGVGKDMLGRAMPQLALGAYDDEDYTDALAYQAGPDDELGVYEVNDGMGVYDDAEEIDL